MFLIINLNSSGFCRRCQWVNRSGCGRGGGGGWGLWFAISLGGCEKEEGDAALAGDWTTVCVCVCIVRGHMSSCAPLTAAATVHWPGRRQQRLLLQLEADKPRDVVTVTAAACWGYQRLPQSSTKKITNQASAVESGDHRVPTRYSVIITVIALRAGKRPHLKTTRSRF